MQLVTQSLALDAQNVDALQTTAALLATQPGLHDDTLEYRIRRRIVALRPGVLPELVPYFRLAIRLTHGGSEGAHIREDARTVQARYVRGLTICEALSDAPVLRKVLRKWSGPLEEIPDLQQSSASLQ